MNAPSSAGVSGPIIAAILTGLVALVVLVVTQYQAQQDARRKDFAEALAAVERYPTGCGVGRTRRRKCADAWPSSYTRSSKTCCSTRAGCASRPPESPTSTITFCGPRERKRASTMTEAWNTPPISRDEDMPLSVKTPPECLRPIARPTLAGG